MYTSDVMSSCACTSSYAFYYVNGGAFIYSFIFFIFVFQEYFSYIESIVEQRWAKTGVPGEKPPDLTEAERGFLTCAPSEA